MPKANTATSNQTTNPIYSYTKAIRFRAQPVDNTESLEIKATESVSLTDFSKMGTEFSENVKKIIFVDYETQKLTDQLTINKNWLKQFFKQEFYDRVKSKNSRGNQYNLKDLYVLKSYFREWFEEWNHSMKELNHLGSLGDENQSRRSEIANQIQQVTAKEYFPLINGFLGKAIHKQKSDLLQKVEQQSHEIKQALQHLEIEYLPAQTAGLVVAQSSMNYHTVNKKPKNWDEKLQEKEQELDSNDYSTIQKNHNWRTKRNIELFTFKSDQEKEWLERYLLDRLNNDGTARLSLRETYDMMKAFKSEQKAIFYEAIKHIASNQNKNFTFINEDFILGEIKFIDWSRKELEGEEKLNQLFNLFNFSSNDKTGKSYTTFLQLEKEIEHLVAQKNQAKSANDNEKARQLSSKITEKKKAKGNYLFGKECYFSAYGNFCEKFKKIAMDLGKIKAQIHGIEKEKIESENTQYWSVIWEEQSESERIDRFLWLIPKEPLENLNKAKKFILNPQRLSTDKAIGEVSYFESLTMRALHKLCFTDEGTFVQDMKKEDQDLYEKYNTAKCFKTNGKDELIREKRAKELIYLKAVLQSSYAHDRLQLDQFELDKVYTARDLQEFELALEKACYSIDPIPFDEAAKKHFIDTHHVVVFKITSYDLEQRNQHSKDRLHTTLWKDFWNPKNTEDYLIRLNPELKIRYREEDENLQQYLQEKRVDLQTHRRLQDQFTINFSFTLNAGRKHPELAFAKPEDLRSEINEFNKKFNNNQDFSTLWRYGVDRGNIELATLCIAKFDPKQTYQHGKNKYLKPSFPTGEKAIKCVQLKTKFITHEDYRSEHKKQQDEKSKIIDNLSYFVDKQAWFENQDDWFEEQSPTCIDFSSG